MDQNELGHGVLETILIVLKPQAQHNFFKYEQCFSNHLNHSSKVLLSIRTQVLAPTMVSSSEQIMNERFKLKYIGCQTKISYQAKP